MEPMRMNASALEQPVVECADLTVSLGGSQILSDVGLSVARGEVVGVRGESGSGKTTLLHALAGLVVPDAGSVHVGGTRIDNLSDQHRSDLRLRRFGVAFQAGDLIPELTIGENVALPLLLLGQGRRAAAERAREALGLFGIDELFDRPLTAVSGGQMQRAALARAMVHQPLVLLADEPTGALDQENASAAICRVVDLARSHGTATVVVTHSAEVAGMCDRVLTLHSGTIVRNPVSA